VKTHLNEVIKSRDSITSKFKFIVDDRYIVDFLLVERPEKNIICFPSQIGCVGTCVFCKSGKFLRDLTSDEIREMINNVKTYIKKKSKNLLLSCMGEGEPSLSYSMVNVFDTIYNSCDKLALATTGANHFIFEEMNRFAHKLKIMLSLHGVTESKRGMLLNNYRNVEGLISMFENYKGKKEVNYVLLENFNDSLEDCRKLKTLCNGIPVKINRYNNTNDAFKMSSNVNIFIEEYKSLGGDIEYYETDGVDIEGACGMMSYQIK
jgi:23S rRNA (adenine2503-C2)-methyltransferase